MSKKIQYCLNQISVAMTVGLEEMFYNLGKLVAINPFKTICFSLSLTALCGLGLFSFYEEKDLVKLWIPENNDFATNHQWLIHNFPPKIRYQSMVLVDETNILRPEVLRYMYEVHKKVAEISTENGFNWEKQCFRLPVVKIIEKDGTEMPNKKKRKKRAVVDESVESFNNFDENTDWFEDDYEDSLQNIINNNAGVGDSADPSTFAYPQPYCGYINRMPTACFEESLLELFATSGAINQTYIENLTQEDIIRTLNSGNNKSGVFLIEKDFSKFFGGIEKNSTGHIIGAKATYINWFSEANLTAASLEKKSDPSRQGMGLDENVDAATLEFELSLRKVLENDCNLPEGLKSYANVHRSFGDVSTETIWGDVTYLTISFMLVYIFVQIMLGKFNRVEQRCFLGLMALVNVKLAVAASFGLCSLVGLPYGPMHTLIICLLIGLGVDNAFVIVQEFNNSEEADQKNDVKRPLYKRIGNGLRRAGVAITITSMTDVIVFTVGASTVLPSLRSYSLYAAAGVLFTFINQITFFVACLTLDTKRIDSKRDGMFWCKKYGETWKPNAFSQKNILQDSFRQLGLQLKKKYLKCLVIFTSVALTSFGIYGLWSVQIEFDFLKFLPNESNLALWYRNNLEYFPEEGFRGKIYFAETDLKGLLPKLRHFNHIMEKSSGKYLADFDPWYPGFEKYLTDYYVDSLEEIDSMSDDLFNEKLTQYLFSPGGGKYRHLFEFANNGTETDLRCGKAAPKVIMSSMRFQHKQFYAASEQLEAMRWLKKIIKDEDFDGMAFALAQPYSRWEIDEVIGWELQRNLVIAIVCVLITTFVLIADLCSCILVLTTILLNLVNVVGYMHFWGLTIDIVAATNIIISVGLCVDFSAHIAHSFLNQPQKTRADRMVAALTSIGPAVFNGGISTLIAIIMLISSQSHVFISYFKIFFLMIIFGLFHGLILLPVVLSLVGSQHKHLAEKDYNDATPSEELKDIKIKLTTNGSPTTNNAEDVENQKEDIHCPS